VAAAYARVRIQTMIEHENPYFGKKMGAGVHVMLFFHAVLQIVACSQICLKSEEASEHQLICWIFADFSNVFSPAKDNV